MQQTHTYRRVRFGRGWVAAMIIVGGIVGICVALMVLPNRSSNGLGALAAGILFGGGLLTVVVAVFVYLRLARGAARRLAQMLEGEGFQAVLAPTAGQAAEVLARIGPVAPL